MEEPNPYNALNRLLDLKPRQRRSLLRLVVRCEQRKHTPLRVFALRDGMLVQCRSDADVRDLQAEHPHLEDWSRRRAFFLDEWLHLANPSTSHLLVVCDCAQTTPWPIDVQKVAHLIPREIGSTRHVAIAEVLASDL